MEDIDELSYLFALRERRRWYCGYRLGQMEAESRMKLEIIKDALNE